MNVLIGCECTGTIRDAFRARGHNAYSCDILPDQNNSVYHIQDDILKVLESEAYRPKTALIIPHDYWDLFIVHPDCTYLTCAAEWCYKDIELQTKKLDPNKLYGKARREAREKALQFVRDLIAASDHIPRVCIENPAYSKINAVTRAAGFDVQFIQPHEYGHDASKKTGLALKGLPRLTPTEHIEPRMVCKNCGNVYQPEYFEGKYKKACIVCAVNGKNADNLLPRWANQTNSGQNRLPPSADRWLLRATTYTGWANAMADQWSR